MGIQDLHLVLTANMIGMMAHRSICLMDFSLEGTGVELSVKWPFLTFGKVEVELKLLALSLTSLNLLYNISQRSARIY